jgi:hypothetical protein
VYAQPGGCCYRLRIALKLIPASQAGLEFRVAIQQFEYSLIRSIASLGCSSASPPT